MNSGCILGTTAAVVLLIMHLSGVHIDDLRLMLIGIGFGAYTSGLMAYAFDSSRHPADSEQEER